MATPEEESQSEHIESTLEARVFAAAEIHKVGRKLAQLHPLDGPPQLEMQDLRLRAQSMGNLGMSHTDMAPLEAQAQIILQQNPNNPVIINDLATIYFAMGEVEKGKDILNPHEMDLKSWDTLIDGLTMVLEQRGLTPEVDTIISSLFAPDSDLPPDLRDDLDLGKLLLTRACTRPDQQAQERVKDVLLAISYESNPKPNESMHTVQFATAILLMARDIDKVDQESLREVLEFTQLILPGITILNEDTIKDRLQNAAYSIFNEIILSNLPLFDKEIASLKGSFDMLNLILLHPNSTTLETLMMCWYGMARVDQDVALAFFRTNLLSSFGLEMHEYARSHHEGTLMAAREVTRMIEGPRDIIALLLRFDDGIRTLIPPEELQGYNDSIWTHYSPDYGGFLSAALEDFRRNLPELQLKAEGSERLSHALAELGLPPRR